MDRLHKPVNADCPPLYKHPKSIKVKPLQEIYTAIAVSSSKKPLCGFEKSGVNQYYLGSSI